MRSTVNRPSDIKRTSLVGLGLLLLAGCHTPDWTKSQPDQCEVHGVTMTRRTVPIAYGMIPLSKAEGERGSWGQRTEYYPNPGDCLPATSINAHGESRAIVFVCRKCEAAKREFEAGKWRVLSPGVVAMLEAEVTRLESSARDEPGPNYPRPSSELAFLLLEGLAARGAAVEELTEAEQLVFSMEPRGGTKASVVSIAPDARVVLEQTWKQDKSGSYTLKTATPFGRREGKWVRVGSGTAAGAE
jgi:hypothetical protein